MVLVFFFLLLPFEFISFYWGGGLWVSVLTWGTSLPFNAFLAFLLDLLGGLTIDSFTLTDSQAGGRRRGPKEYKSDEIF